LAYAYWLGCKVLCCGPWEKMWNPCYEICYCTTKSTVYPYYFHTIFIVWKYTIIMNNQKSILFPMFFSSRSYCFVMVVFAYDAFLLYCR
jgi:hypothetical protein